MSQEKYEVNGVRVTRKPIIINESCIALIQLFRKRGLIDHIEDIWTIDYSQGGSERDAAEQLISQLEDEWSPALLMAIRDVITERLVQHDKECGTSFARRAK